MNSFFFLILTKYTQLRKLSAASSYAWIGFAQVFHLLFVCRNRCT